MLDVSAARSLQRLSLDGLRFEQLVLPDSCTLACSMHADAPEYPPEMALLDLRNMSKVLVAAELSLPYLDCTVLESLGSRCQRLHSFGVGLGTPSIPLHFPGNLASLLVLQLSGRSMHITLPHAMQLRELRIEAGGSLEVSLGSPVALSKTLMNCRVLYCQLQGTGLTSLFRLLAAAGKSTVPIERSWRYGSFVSGMQTQPQHARQGSHARRHLLYMCMWDVLVMFASLLRPARSSAGTDRRVPVGTAGTLSFKSAD